jgi:hypothetical protein
MKEAKGIAWHGGNPGRQDWKRGRDGTGGGLLDVGQLRAKASVVGVEPIRITLAAILGG